MRESRIRPRPSRLARVGVKFAVVLFAVLAIMSVMLMDWRYVVVGMVAFLASVIITAD